MKNQNKYLVKLKEELLSLQRELKNISAEYDKQIFELQEEINSIKIHKVLSDPIKEN